MRKTFFLSLFFLLTTLIAYAETEIPRTDGTAIGTMTSSGGLAASFDGNANQDHTASSRGPANTNNTTVGKDWGVGVTHTISHYTVTGNNTASGGSFNATTGLSYTIKLQGSTDNFSSSVVDLYTDNFTTSDGTSNPQVRDITSGITTTTAYRYHRLVFTSNGAVNEQYCAEVQFYESPAARRIITVT